MRSGPTSARGRDAETIKKYSKTKIHPKTFPIASPERSKKRCAWNTASLRSGTLDLSESPIPDSVCFRRARWRAPKSKVRCEKRRDDDDRISEPHVEVGVKLPA